MPLGLRDDGCESSPTFAGKSDRQILSMELGPKQNLFKSLPPLERVTAP